VAIGKSVGLQQDGIEQAREGYANDPRDDAILAFALQVVRSRGAVSDTELAVFRDAVGNDGLAIEIVANVALNILTNYVNRVAQTDVDFPLTRLEPAA
jgi:alkylhydroperoxidase family enzyme